MQTPLPDPARKGFTLVEVMVSTGLVVLISALLVASMSDMSRVWSRGQAQITTFQHARNAFESITLTLSQATLNPYWRAFDSDSGASVRYAYVRESDLHFISGPAADSKLLNGSADVFPSHAAFFQAPLGRSEATATNLRGRLKYSPLDQMLTAAGYWIQWTDGRSELPKMIEQNFPDWPERWRFRLHEMQQPAEKLSIFDPQKRPPTHPEHQWLIDSLVKDSAGRYQFARVVSENIIALVLLPKLAERDRATPNRPDDLTKNYRYDSREALYGNATGNLPAGTPRKHQLPPMMEVVMIAIDEESGVRTQAQYGSTPPTWMSNRFKTVGTNDQLEKELIDLQAELIESRINARVFRAEVLLRASKWSRDAQL